MKSFRVDSLKFMDIVYNYRDKNDNRRGEFSRTADGEIYATEYIDL